MYLIVMSIAKLVEQSVWRVLGNFFVDMVIGWKNHLYLLNLSPQQVPAMYLIYRLVQKIDYLVLNICF